MPQNSRRPVRLRLDPLEARDVPVNLLVTASSGFSSPKNVVEYNPNGGIVSNRIIPPNPASGEQYVRDVDVNINGRIVVLNGTNKTAVSIFNGTDWVHINHPGMSSLSDPSVGGLTTAGRFVWAPDMTTAGEGEPNGIVRIDLNTMTATRFLELSEYVDLNIGLDGMLYGLVGEFGPIHVIDPATMALSHFIIPGGGSGGQQIYGLRGVAADADGNMYVVSLQQAVYKLDPNGLILDELQLPTPGEGGTYGPSFDIDISNNGQKLVIGGLFGYVFQMSTGLTNLTSFRAGTGAAQVTFKEPPPPLIIPDIRVNNTESPEGDVGTSPLTFTVSLSEASNRTVTVDYVTRNGTAESGSDYSSTAGTISFAPGQTSRTITVDILGDIIDEQDETVELVLTGSRAGIIVDDVGVGTIRNDEITPDVTIADTEVVEGDTTASMVFTVTLSEPANRPVSVVYTALAGTATEGTEFTATTGTLTFSTGQTSRTVTVPLTGDTDDEPDETLYLTLSDPTNCVIVDMQGEGIILDDDGTPVANVSDAAPVTEGNTGSVPVTFKVKLSKVPKTPVTVNYATQDGTAIAGEDYDALTGTLTFEAGQNTKTVTVNVRPDRVAEPDETFELVLSDPTGGAELGDATAGALIKNDDIPPVAKAGPDRVINEGATVAFRATGSSGVAPLTYTWDFGDGTPTATGFAPRHKFVDSSPATGPYVVTLTVRDGNGSVSTDTALVTSRNLKPRGGMTGPGASVPGWVRPLTFTGFDASPADKAALEYRINWGDGQSETIIGGPKLAAGHMYAAPGDYTVRLVVADDDGGVSKEYVRMFRVKPTLLAAGTLYVPGTTGNDTIEVRSANDAGTKVEVAVNGTVAATGSPGTVTVFGWDGDDTITVVGPVARRLVLLGGAGNDALNATTAAGPVVLSGGDGDDLLTGGSGRDVLVGGAGVDQLDGGADDDVAVGEALTFGSDVIGLRKLSLEWARATVAATYESRRDRVSGVATNGLNKPYFVGAATLVADADVDLLTGGAGRDWFIDVTATPNTLQDPAIDETVTTI